MGMGEGGPTRVWDQTRRTRSSLDAALSLITVPATHLRPYLFQQASPTSELPVEILNAKVPFLHPRWCVLRSSDPAILDPSLSSNVLFPSPTLP